VIADQVQEGVAGGELPRAEHGVAVAAGLFLGRNRRRAGCTPAARA